MTEVTVQIGGTKADVDGFLRSLRYSPEIQVVETTQSEQPLNPDQPFGQVELVNVLVSFGTSLAAGTALELVKHEFQRYRQGRPHMKLDESPDPDSRDAETEGQLDSSPEQP